jgi:serine/threonine protein kinase
MANVLAIGHPVNDSERKAIAHLKQFLPSSFTILHNFEIVDRYEAFEVDLAILAPHAVYLVDVKGIHGEIEVYGSRWHPSRHAPYHSPLPKLRQHAKKLKSLIMDSNPGRFELRDVYVDAAVLLTEDDAKLVDPGGQDIPFVTQLDKSVGFFQNASRIPANFSKNIRASLGIVQQVIQGKSRARTGPARFGNWIIDENLGGTDHYTEHRAHNYFTGYGAGTVLLRIYKADPYRPENERKAEEHLIANAYLALGRLPSHPGIVAAKDFFATEEQDRYVLVIEDAAGQALRLYMQRPQMALTFDQKVEVARDILAALDHAHTHGVVHRNLNPNTILIAPDDQARLTGFDFARPVVSRTSTIAGEIIDELERDYLAPEVLIDPGEASPTSDVFSVGLILFELLTGDKPFGNTDQMFEQSAVFPIMPSEQRADVPKTFDDWLQSLCAFDPKDRPSAIEALATLEAVLGQSVDEPSPDEDVDYYNLPQGYILDSKYSVEKKLGSGGFGTVYSAIEILGDVTRAVKLILRDRTSTIERLRSEYKTLLRVPLHPNVVKVITAGTLPNGGPPYIVFEYLDGIDLAELIGQRAFTPQEALELGLQVADGLQHLHANSVYHCDIKPRNLLWTSSGAKIIDFNVSVLFSDHTGHGGGSRKYLPPDLDLSVGPQPPDLVDRDLYALALTLYEAVTYTYPWNAPSPPPNTEAPDPRTFPERDDLSPEFVSILMKAISPKRADRFGSVAEFEQSLRSIKQVRQPKILPPAQSSSWTISDLLSEPSRPNINPFVSRLLTLYSQSKYSNSGTRGLDEISRLIYVDTALDRDLVPAVTAGEFRLVVITGNAGDGKTALIQKLEERAQKGGGTVVSGANGSRIEFNGRKFLSNYDGSQDEGERVNDEVLLDFFDPFSGTDSLAWSDAETLIIAINEGRLVDFLSEYQDRFPRLKAIVFNGLSTGIPEDGVAVVNLNLRSVVATSEGSDGSILERLVRRMTDEKFWRPCENCDLKDRCYILHNAKTFQDSVAGPKVVDRLKTLYTLTHLRGRLHITLRDLRSALAFTLTSNRDCDEAHELYAQGRRSEILSSYYFNSWMGGYEGSKDRLLKLLRDIDIGLVTDPGLDRSIDFTPPAIPPEPDRNLLPFEQRSRYDDELFRREFEGLLRDVSGRLTEKRLEDHRNYVGAVRRRYFFERRDDGWREMLPYRTGAQMLDIIRREIAPLSILPQMLRAINRGEGMRDLGRIQGNLVLGVRHVEKGTIRSYRVFPAQRFELFVPDEAERARFVEHMPRGLVLRYRSEVEGKADLIIDLDLFEMLFRLNEGYLLSVDERQGSEMNLAAFKNILSSVPYNEVLLTEAGQDFFKIKREQDGLLVMEHLAEGVRNGAAQS